MTGYTCRPGWWSLSGRRSPWRASWWPACVWLATGLECRSWRCLTGASAIMKQMDIPSAAGECKYWAATSTGEWWWWSSLGCWCSWAMTRRCIFGSLGCCTRQSRGSWSRTAHRTTGDKTIERRRKSSLRNLISIIIEVFSHLFLVEPERRWVGVGRMPIDVVQTCWSVKPLEILLVVAVVVGYYVRIVLLVCRWQLKVISDDVKWRGRRWVEIKGIYRRDKAGNYRVTDNCAPAPWEMTNNCLSTYRYSSGCPSSDSKARRSLYPVRSDPFLWVLSCLHATRIAGVPWRKEIKNYWLRIYQPTLTRKTTAKSLFTFGRRVEGVLLRRKRRLTLFLILTKITMQTAMRISVTTTPTRTPSTGVIWTSTALDEAGETRKNIHLLTFIRKSFWSTIVQYHNGLLFLDGSQNIFADPKIEFNEREKSDFDKIFKWTDFWGALEKTKPSYQKCDCKLFIANFLSALRNIFGENLFHKSFAMHGYIVT